MKKQISIMLVVLLMALVAVNVAGAQGPNNPNAPRRGDGKILEAISEATGLDALELAQTARETDTSLADLITQNGGDVVAVQAQIVAEIVAQTGRDEAEVKKPVAAYRVHVCTFYVQHYRYG